MKKNIQNILLVVCIMSLLSFSHALAQGKGSDNADADAEYKKAVAAAEEREREIQKKVRDTNEKMRVECEAYAQAEKLTPLRAKRVDNRSTYCTKKGKVVPTKRHEYYVFITGGKRDGKMVLKKEEDIVSKEKIRQLLGAKCASTCKQGVVAVVRPDQLSAAQRAFSCNQGLEKSGYPMYAFCRENEEKVQQFNDSKELISGTLLTNAEAQALLKSEQSRIKSLIASNYYLEPEEAQRIGREYGALVQGYSERFGKNYDAFLDRLAEANADLYGQNEIQNRIEDKVFDDGTWKSLPRSGESESYAASRERGNRIQIYRGILCSAGRMTDSRYCVNGAGDAPPRFRDIRI